MRALIFNIKRFAIHDGPGIRTTFFLKGCPLECMWCHNPEGIATNPVMVERIDRIGEREFVRQEVIGKEYSAGEILDFAAKDRVFMEQSGGGVTFSGGEPMMQIDFLEYVLRLLRAEGYETAVDTSGMVPLDFFRRVVDHTSLFLFDIKHLDSKIHEKIAGQPNLNILKNLDFLLKCGAPVEIRIPLIPGLNDSEEQLAMMRDYIASLNRGSLTGISLLPFHTSGKAKYNRLGLKYPMEGTVQPGPERIKEVADLLSQTGLKVLVGG